jgi:hypothetical protein
MSLFSRKFLGHFTKGGSVPNFRGLSDWAVNGEKKTIISCQQLAVSLKNMRLKACQIRKGGSYGDGFQGLPGRCAII